MVKHAFWLLLLASGCFEERYRCTSDLQCDLGEGGRCETDGYCSTHDITCATQRRYGAHTAELAGQCVDDRIVPANACAGGQSPAKPEGCFAAVCARLPACCDLAWTDACVQIAQEVCELRCDTRIAITATRGMVTELWDARFSDAWTFEQRPDLTTLAWTAPAPGASEPRLAGATTTELVIGETRIDVPPDRTYQSITSVNVERDRRDTVVAAYSTTMGNRAEIWKLDTRTASEMGVPGAVGLTWGDVNRDTFPDALVKNGSQQFNFLHNLENDQLQRRLSNQSAGNVAGGGTPGAPPLRSFDWIDLNGDAKLDLIVFGAEVRIHNNALGLGDAAARQIDCDPPSAARACSTDVNEPNLEAASFGGAALPTSVQPGLVITQFPGRKLFRVEPNAAVTPLEFPGDSCSCTKTCTGGCPGPDCTCTYNCTACVPVLALVVRDIDHDRMLDLIAIDARLQVYVGKAANGYQFGGPTAIPTGFPNTFFSVDVSVTGAPIP
jgi:hypothetical protein